MLKNICKIFARNLENQVYKQTFTFLSLKTMNTFMFSNLKSSDPIDMNLDRFIKTQSTIQKLKSKGIESFFPIQAHTFEHIYEGMDLIAGDKTGSGKTMAFTLPVIQRMREENILGNRKGIKFVILAPTRELAVQIASQIESLKEIRNQFHVLPVFGGSPVSFNERELRKNPDILVGTPGRVTDLIGRGLLNFEKVETVCVDEADYMFDIGFKQPIGDILQEISKKTKRNCQYLCFSATLNNQVALLTSRYMKNNKKIVKMYDENSKKTPITIKHHYVTVSEFDKVQMTKKIIKSKSNGGRVIIFVNTKKQGTNLSAQLGIDNVCLNGDVEQKVRFARLNQFKKGEVKVLVATDVAARGLDIPNVELVIHFDQPNNVESYIHRSGRTGRAGKDGVSMMFISTRQQQAMVREIEKKLDIRVKRFNEQLVNRINQINQDPQKPIQPVQQPQLKQRSEKIVLEPEYELSQTQFILFDNRDKIQAHELKEQLTKKGIKFTKFNQIFTNRTTSKFYLIEVTDENDKNKLLVSNFGELKSRFSRKRIYKRRVNHNGYNS